MRQADGHISYSLYLSGLATVFCGLAAVNSVLSDSSFATLTGVLLCTGYATSMLLRRLGYTARLVELAIIAAALLIYAQLIGGRAAGEMIVPIAALESPELRLAALLLWLEVLRSFTLVSDEAVVFSAVPSVVLISLAATNNVNPEIMTLFVIYLVLTAFLLAHRPGVTRPEVKSRLRLALVVTILSMIIGSAVVIPIRLACTKAFAAAMPEFTRLRDRFSITGYADTNFLQIAQGPIRLSDVEVMTVKSHEVGSEKPVSAYWRGRIFDHYTGHGWQVSVNYTSLRPPGKRGRDGNYTYQLSKPSSAGRQSVYQEVWSRVPISRELFAVAEPIVVQAPYRTMERNKFNSWRGIYGHSGVTKYQVVSSLPITDPARLRRAGADYAGIGSAFLQRITSTARVGDLARRITQGIHNPYEKVVAIQRYLGEQYTYDLNAPPAPGGADAVDYFLFNSRVGYCDVFASAMVVMCREVGIPARLATGFSSGVYDPQFDLFRVRDMDRHAWAEVYFPGCGWVTFDPTELTHGQSQSWLRHIVLSLRRAAGELFGGPTALPMTILLLVICAAIAFGSELRSIRISRRMDGPSRLHAAAVARYAAIRRSLHVDGAHLTPIEAVSTAALGSPEAARIALEAANLFCRVRYGYSGVIPDDIQRLDRLHTELKAALRHARRLSSKAH